VLFLLNRVFFPGWVFAFIFSGMVMESSGREHSASTVDAACCGFCGMLCDDLTLKVAGGSIEVTAFGCPKAAQAFAQASGAAATKPSPRIKGREVSLEQAIAHGAKLLGTARRPLFAGLSTDVQGMRGLAALAETAGAVMDHRNSPAKFRNILTVQSQGWITTTFAEVRNRADLIIMVGTTAVKNFPRFFDRLVWPQTPMFLEDIETRQVVMLGPETCPQASSPAGRAAQHLPCAIEDLPAVVAALRARLNGASLDVSSVAGIPVSMLDTLIDQIRASRYSVFVWAAPDLPEAHGELTTQMLSGLLQELNQTVRAAGLPLGGNDGDFSADAVLLWQTGFPFRVSLAQDSPQYDPYLQSAQGLLERQEADLLLWTAALGPHAAPRTNMPTLVLAGAGAPPDDEADVWIPVATPGVDDQGHLFRGDKIISLHLEAHVNSGLPGVKSVAQALTQALGGNPC
jgi:formylmethanofuran dehydrogenase subunit B